MPEQAVLFYNPTSGRYQAKKIGELLQAFADCGVALRPVSDPAELRTLRNNHIVVAGGDGTLHVAINHADVACNSFSILPIGSGNDFAANFPKTAVPALAEKIRLGACESFDILKINDVYAHNACGTGFEAFVASRAKKVGIPSLKYIIPIARHLLGYKPIQATIHADGYVYSGPIFMVSMGNGMRAGGGFKLYPNASLQDGKMDVLLIKPPSILQRLWYVWLVNFGAHLKLNVVTYMQVSACRIQLEKPHEFQADGDTYTAQEMNINVIAGGLKLLM